MPSFRPLTSAERAVVRAVFADSVPYDRVRICDLDLGGPVALAGRGLRSSDYTYAICWGRRGFQADLSDPATRATLVHEMTHMWQGHNGRHPLAYIAQSAWSQLSHGLRDMARTRDWFGFARWGAHRGTAYTFAAADIGRDWASFNVEQQASIVESWFMPEQDRLRLRRDFGPGVTGGGASPDDSRFPYIRDVIRAGDRHAAYRR